MINVFTRKAIAIAAAAGIGILVGSATITAIAQSNDAKRASAATHKIAIQVNQNDKALMDLALNNAKNVIDYYQSKGEKVAVEIVTYGPGLHMLRADTSPVKDRIAVMSLENANVTFAACGNTQAKQSGKQARGPHQRSQGHAIRCGASHGAAETGLRLHQAIAQAGVLRRQGALLAFGV